MEYSKLFNARDLIEGVLRGNGINVRNEKNISGKTVGGETPGNQSGPLIRVTGDIGDILGKLKYMTTSSSKRSKVPNSKIGNDSSTEHKSFGSERNIFQKFNSTRIPSRINKLSRSSIRIRNKKKLFEIIPRPSSPNNVNSNQILRKGPVEKLKLQTFKKKIVLSADTLVESAEKSMTKDGKKTANLSNLMIDKSSNGNKYNTMTPFLNIEKLATQSLHSFGSKHIPALKNNIEKRAKYSTSESESEIDSFAKLNIIPKKKSLIKKKDNTENRQGNIRKRVTIDNSSSKEENNSKCLPNISQKKECKDDYVSDKYENYFIENKCLVNSRHSVQTFKDSRNVRRNLNISKVPQRSSTTRNSILNRKFPLSKSTVNTNSVSKKIVMKNKLNINESKKSVNSTQNKDDNVQLSEFDKKLTQMRRKNKTRSNATLNNISADDTWNTINNATSVVIEPSVVKKSSITSSKKNAVRRGSSLIENTRTGMLTVPKRTSSSISAKLLNEKLFSGRRISSHSNFYEIGNTMKTNSFRIILMKQLREEVNIAIKNRKTFTIFGDYPAVRKALQIRGWVEKFDITNTEKLEQQIVNSSYRITESKNPRREKNLDDICKRLVQSKLLSDHQVDLYWVTDTLEVNFDKIQLTKINKLENNIFSHADGKGLSDAIKKADWFNFPGLANIKHPRTYSLTSNEETMEFIKDFRLTAAISLLKWVIRSHQKGNCKIVSSSGNIPLQAFQFATNECFKKVIEANNPDMNQAMTEANDNEWNEFLEYYYNIIHIGHHFETSNLETETSMIEKSTYVIERLTPLYPNIDMDGLLNIWILKPTESYQKKGIHICRTLQYIMKTSKNTENIKYIVQKYIEKPLLILNTKFDIRQWFLISSTMPLTVWMYKEYYLRFSTQNHNLRKLHESIHASNNYLSKQYQNNSHNITLPNYNMWDSQQFKNFLTSNGTSEVFSEVTYKGMKECIIWAVLIHQDKMDKRRNSFELFEADFMLTEDFHPWLIEIYPNPILKSTNPVTSRMSSRVLEDTIKVVIDRAENPKAETGNFELIYKQSIIPNRTECNLKLFGKAIPDDYFCFDKNKKRKQVKKDLPETKSEIRQKGLTETLESLLKFIQNEKKKRRNKGLITEGTDPIKIFDTTVEDRKKLFMNLKSEMDKLVGGDDIPMAEEDKKMIDYALKMLKNRNNGEVIKYLMEIIYKILNRSIPKKNKH